MHEYLSCALAGLAVSAGLAFSAWLWSLRQRDASVIDPVWPLMIAGAGLGYAACLPPAGERGFLVLGLALIWALRLCLHLVWRRRDHPGEDRRYQAIRARHEPNFGIKSVYLVFGLQAVLAWCVSAPLGVAWASSSPLRWPDMLGAAIALFGLVFEALADAQLAVFRADPASRGAVMDQGLWRYSRHPNYFGEALFWWGLWLFGMASGHAPWWTVAGPVVITAMLRFVSIPLIDARMQASRPDYERRMRRVSALVPWFPSRETGR